MTTATHRDRPDRAELTTLGAWLVWLLPAAAAAALAVWLAPKGWVPTTDAPAMPHYGQLMMATGRNLLAFMFVVFLFAYAYVITGVRQVFGIAGLLRPTGVRLERWNTIAGLAFGVYMAAVVAYLTWHLVVPVTQDHGWRGWLDIVSIGCYLAVLAPASLFALMSTGAVRTTGWRVLGGTIALVILAHAAMLGMWPLEAGFAGAAAGHGPGH